MPRKPRASVGALVYHVLNRSVGGLGILVGNEYPVGSIIAVLPVSASHLTPWVEAEVKTESFLALSKLVRAAATPPV